jgi:hypothetical protein
MVKNENVNKIKILLCLYSRRSSYILTKTRLKDYSVFTIIYSRER